MKNGWQYRLTSVFGVILLSSVIVSLINNAAIQIAVQQLPVLARLSDTPSTAPEFTIELLLTVAVLTGALIPMYKPRPRRILDIVAFTHKRVFVAIFALATIGYFDYTYRLPRLSLLLVTPLLLVALPAWFIWIRQRPTADGERTLVVGDDVDAIETVLAAVEGPIVGYLCPTSLTGSRARSSVLADGGEAYFEVDRLGGLSRIEDVLIEYDIDTVVLAFGHTDRAEFFGALDACYEHGVDAKVHREQTDSVLVGEESMGDLVDVDIEPWDIQDYILKRAFDVAFAGLGLLILSPVMLCIALAIKLEDGGPVFYQQERTAVFGETFDIYKFRSMTPEGESVEPIEDDENDRITSVGRILRQTHLDEIPQLWSVLHGKMSVVGPRAVWTDEEHLLEAESEMWRKRWFVKPGLTGLAQVQNASSTDPAEKLRYDLEYVKKQSFQYDVKLVLRQIWMVLADFQATLRNIE